jgi:3-oxoacyl-[acyl-carrier protein] reductase
MKRRVFITGAARGIGAAVAAKYRDSGHEVIAPRREDLDLSSPESIKRYISAHGLECDVLINNAGENKIAPIAETQLEDWERTLNVNLTAAFLLIQATAPAMAQRGWGRIVNVSSIYSHLARGGRSPYSSSKSGLNGLTRTAAVEFARQNVLVNAVCPGFVATEMTSQNNSPEQIAVLANQTPMGRLANPPEVAELIHFLGSDLNTYLTGQSIIIDGGFSIQ